jgi:hypothetical protein
LFIFRVLLIFNILEVDSTNRREIFIDSLLACVGEIVSRGDEATNSRTYTMYREQKVTELVRFTRRLWEGKSAKGGPEVCSAGALGDVIVFLYLGFLRLLGAEQWVRTEPPQPIPTPSPSDFKSKHKFVFIILKVTLHSHRMCQAMDRGISSIQT